MRTGYVMAAAALAIALTGCGGETGGGESAETGSEPAEAVMHGSDAVDALAAAGQLEWRLLSLSDGVLVPDEIVTTIRFEGDEFSGQGPCNRYFGSRNTNPEIPGLLGPVGATRMMCPETQMLYEDQYFEALGGVRNARIEAGRLVMDWESAEASGELVFAKMLTAPEAS